MSCNRISDGIFRRTASVDSQGSLQVQVAGVDSVVDALPAAATVTTTTATVGTTSGQLVATNATRRQIDIQNLDAANPIHIVLGSSTATTDHFRIGPRERYSFPAGVAYTGVITAIADVASAKAVVHEFNET